MTAIKYTYNFPKIKEEDPTIIYTSTTTAGKQPTDISIKPVLNEDEFTWSVGDIKDTLDRVKETSELDRLDSVIEKLKRKHKKCI